MVTKAKFVATVPVADIVPSIFPVRRHHIFLDGELATIYGVETRVRIQAVKRHVARFESLSGLVAKMLGRGIPWQRRCRLSLGRTAHWTEAMGS